MTKVITVLKVPLEVTHIHVMLAHIIIRLVSLPGSNVLIVLREITVLEVLYCLPIVLQALLGQSTSVWLSGCSQISVLLSGYSQISVWLSGYSQVSGCIQH